LIADDLRIETYVGVYTGHTQKNGAVLIVNIIKTAPFFCVFPVFTKATIKVVFNCASVGVKNCLISEDAR
jgi:hypothetical protein